MLGVDLLLLGVSWVHVLLAPYTKVEESFNLHATHDVFFYGVSPSALKQYDHFVFPGAVPRSFIGSIALAWTTKPLVAILSMAGLVTTKFQVQVLLRLVLATANAFTLIRIRSAVSQRFGQITALFFGLLLCSQFHLPFWMGRTLPNMFAMIPFNEALARTVSRPSLPKVPICLLAFAAVIFRAEIAVYLAAYSGLLLIERRSRFKMLLIVGVVSSLLSLAATTLVDSYFWQRWPLWPEMYGIYFNIVQGKSAEWGIMPWHLYFTNSLPKMLISALPLGLVGVALDTRPRTLLFPAATLVAVMSMVGHKEWRFVVYVVPVFNVAAACACAKLWERGAKNLLYRLIILGALGTSMAATIGLTTISYSNYPGGVALREANLIPQDNVTLHICNLAAQTGASLFLQEHQSPHLTFSGIAQNITWRYDKTEGVVDLSRYTHAIVEELASARTMRLDGVVDSFSGLSKRGLRYAPALWLVSNPKTAGRSSA